MVLAFEILLAAGLVLVAVSLALVILRRVSEHLLVLSTIALGVSSAAGAAAFVVLFVGGRDDAENVLLVAGGLVAATAAEAGLVAVNRSLERARRAEALNADALRRLDEFLAVRADERRAELERALAQERAHTLHLLTEQEKGLAAERREAVQAQNEQAEAALTEAVTLAQSRLERRLAAWIEDVERGQRAREGRLAELARRQSKDLGAYDARIAANAELLASATDEQREELTRLREYLEKASRELSLEAQTELEAFRTERRKAIEAIDERLRTRERDLREKVEREELEATTRLSASLTEAEKRQVEKFSRAIDRAATRHVEEAERRFDEQIRASREKSAERLARELEKTMDEFTRQAEKEVADRISGVAQVTAERLQRRIEDLARAAEAQQETSDQRLRFVSERLQDALAGAEERIKVFEEQIEIELAAKVAELERTIRATERT